MNLYDTKQINCYRCGKWIGEVDWEAVINCPKCGSCADPYPKGYDLLPQTIVQFTKTKKKREIFN